MNSLKSKIFFPHLALIVLLIASLSYSHYKNELDRYVRTLIEFHSNSSLSIVATCSLAISGENYGNLQLPSFIDELNKNKKLLYIDISGNSDNSNNYIKAVYDKEKSILYRKSYPQNYEEILKNKIKKLNDILKIKQIDKVKIDFLISRTKDKLDQYNQNILYKKNKEFERLLKKQSPYIDYKNNKLYLQLLTTNKNKGRLNMIFDTSELIKIRHDILLRSLIEFITALFLSVIVLTYVSNKLVKPLNTLSTIMEKDLEDIYLSKIDISNDYDEIRILSSRFKVLLEKNNIQHEKIKNKAYFDNLTGIYNRNKLDEIFNEEINRFKRYGTKLSVALIDIDHFKKINDVYGHLVGDEILIMLTKNINSNIRENDTIARWGGEEFVILFSNISAEDAKKVSIKLKDSVENLKHKTAGGITISLGLTEVIDSDDIDTILKRCDRALYIAKDNGRNRVEIL